VTLVETQPGDWNREKSQKVMEAFLVKYDDIDGVYAGDDNMGVGALNAAKAAGREGIIFVGATNFAVGYEAMEAGEYWGSIYQSPVDDAKAALQTAIDVLDGKDVPFLNYFDTPKITQDNMSEFHQAGLLSLVEFLSGRGERRVPSFLLSLTCDRGGEHGPVVWALLHCHRSRARNWPSHRRGAPGEGADVCFADIDGDKVAEVAASNLAAPRPPEAR
jgi:hypothetical protein